MPTILVIDDSTSMLAMVENMLAGAGYHVRTCTSGKAALRLIAQEPFDLIVTDLYMPEGDGLEVISKLRETGRQVPILAMSGMMGHLSVLKVAKLLGARHTLAKPFSQEELLAAVETILEAKPRLP